MVPPRAPSSSTGETFDRRTAVEPSGPAHWLGYTGARFGLALDRARTIILQEAHG